MILMKQLLTYFLQLSIKFIKLSQKIEKKVVIWGDGKVRREFLYVLDLAKIVLIFLDNIERFPNVFNVGIGRDFSVLEYYEMVSKIVCWDGEFEFDQSKPVGMKQKLLDISFLKNWGLKNLLKLKMQLKIHILII